MLRTVFESLFSRKSVSVFWWYALCVMAVCGWYFGNLRLTLVAIGVLSLYGWILFASWGLVARSHSHIRIAPWLFLGLGFAVACTGNRWWFADPHFPSISAEKDPFELPLSVDRVELDMTPEQVSNLLGEPDSKSGYHFGEAEFLSDSFAMYLVRTLIKSGFDLGVSSQPNLVSRLEELCNGPSPSSPPDITAKVLEYVNEAKAGKKFRVVVVDPTISGEDTQTAFAEVDRTQMDCDRLIVLTLDPGSRERGFLLTETDSGECWRYDGPNLEVVFSLKKPTVQRVRGENLTIEGRDWTHAGGELNRFRTPGRPYQRIRGPRYSGRHHTTTYGKDWGNCKVLVTATSERITRIEIRSR